MTKIENRVSLQWFLLKIIKIISLAVVESLSIISSDWNLYFLTIVNYIFLEAIHEYCMVHMLKNLVTNIWDCEIMGY